MKVPSEGSKEQEPTPEWETQNLVLPVQEVEKIASLLENPLPSSPALVQAMRRHR